MIARYKGMLFDKDGKQVEVGGKGFQFGECDICDKVMTNRASGFTLVSENLADFDDMAYADGWLRIGKHLICDECREHIERGVFDISIKVKSERAKK